MSEDLYNALNEIPDSLKKPLIEHYEKALSEYQFQNWEGLGTAVGKICEIIYSIVYGKIEGEYSDKIVKPKKDMVTDCRGFEQYNQVHGPSLCISIPRVLISLYEIRNNRGIAHYNDDIAPNRMDAEFMIRATKWLMAELVHHFHSDNIEEAYNIIESITKRNLPVIWKKGDDIVQILNTKLTSKEKVLILLYGEDVATINQLLDWTKYQNKTEFKSKVIQPMYKEALVYFKETDNEVHISPLGIKFVEENNLLSFDK